MQHDEDDFINFMQAMLGPLSDQQTYEQAAQDAISDYRTEQQQSRIDWCAHN